MDTSQKMFLLAVEEMNFTRAAKRAHVTSSASANISSIWKRSWGPGCLNAPPG